MKAAAVPRLDRGQHPFPPFRFKPVAEVLRGFDVIHRENTVFTQVPFLVSGSTGLPIGCRQLGKAAHPFTDTDRHTQLQPLPQVIPDQFRQQQQIIFREQLTGQENADILTRFFFKCNSAHLFIYQLLNNI
ncbi:hypothetical protein D3C80_1186850 [compost metagenome]